MFQSRAFQALSCALALSVCTPSFAATRAPDQPSHPLSMVELMGPYTGPASANPNGYLRLASTDPIPPSYRDLDVFPYRSFAVDETHVYDAHLGKTVSQITLKFRNPDSLSVYENITFKLDPDHEIGDVARHTYQYNQYTSTGLPDLSAYVFHFGDFYPSQNRFSIVDLQRDASGKIISMAGNFDIWGDVYRLPSTFQVTGRFWFNSAALNVPEPDTIALLLAGLATTGLIARLRKPATAKTC